VGSRRFIPARSIGAVCEAPARKLRAAAETAETALIEDEEKHLFEGVVASLPAHYREILALRHARGLSYRDIAELTGISMGTVMSRLSRARGHLVSRIKESEARTTPRRPRFCREAVAA
jgi:RNA polymerase sigma factor (sigma-70 family)